MDWWRRGGREKGAGGARALRAAATTAAFEIEALEGRVLLAVTAVTFSNPVETTITGTGAPIIATDVGDLNGDGVPDIVALGGASALGLAFAAQPFIGSATGALKGGNAVIAGGPAIALGDFTGD